MVSYLQKQQTKNRWITEILLNHFFAIFKVPRPIAFETETRPETFYTETRKNRTRDSCQGPFLTETKSGDSINDKSFWESKHLSRAIIMFSVKIIHAWTSRATRGGRSQFFRFLIRSSSKIFESGSGTGSGNFSNLRIRVPFRLWLQSSIQP